MIRFRILRRHETIALALLSIIGIGAVFLVPGHSRAQAPATMPSSNLAGLRLQRIETLRQASDVSHRMFEQGTISMDEVFRIDRLLLDAQLQSATSADDRRKLLQKALEVARKQEELATRQSQAGRALPLAPLEAKADRLCIEIQLAETAAK